MKRLYILISFVLLSTLGFGQAGNYQTLATGNWTSNTSWQRHNGTSWVNCDAGVYPTDTSGAITILNGHTITTNANISIDETTVASGGTLTVGSSTTLTVADGSGDDLTNNGSISIAVGSPFPPPPTSDGILTVNGKLVNNGTGFSGTSTTRLLFNANSYYDHQVNPNTFALPLATWNSSSTCEVSGSASGLISLGNLNQSFGNFILNSTGLTGADYYDFNGQLTDINGDFDIQSTGSGAIYFTLSTAYTLNIDGDFTIGSGASTVLLTYTPNVTINVLQNFSSDAGYLLFTNANTTTLDVNGDFTLGSGSVDLTYDAAGTTNINIAGDIDIDGSILSKNADGTVTIKADGSSSQAFLSNLTTSALNIDFVVGNSSSILDMSGYNLVIGGDLTLNNSSALDINSGYVESSLGTFTVNSNCNLYVGSTDASGAVQTGTSAGNIRVGGTRTYTSGSTIIYNGSGAQYIGNGHPSTAGVNCTINNSGNGVTLANDATIGGNLLLLNASDLSVGNYTLAVTGTTTLTSGDISVNSGTLTNTGLVTLNSNSINNTSGTINFNGGVNLGTGEIDIGTGALTIGTSYNGSSTGTIAGSSSADLTISGGTTVTGDLKLSPIKETLEDFTYNAGSDLVLATNLTIASGGTLAFGSTGNLDFSGDTLTINGDITQSGSGGLESSSTSDFIIGGIGAMTSIPFPGSSSQLRYLKFNRSSGTYTWSGTVTVTDTIDLKSGTVTHSGGLTPASDATFCRSAGTSFTSTELGGTNAYNVEYNGTLTTGTELPSSGTRLTNLILNGSVTLNKAITVNGDVYLNSGTFTLSGGGSNLTMKGSNWYDNGGSTNQGTNKVIFNGNTTIGGTDNSDFTNIQIEPSSTLILGTGIVNISGNIVNNGTLSPSTSSLVFTGTTSITGTGTKSVYDITINNGSTLTTASGTHNISGDFTNLAGGTLVSTGSTWNFNGTDQDITLNGESFHNLTMAGTGTKTIQDELSVSNDLQISSNVTLDVDLTNETINVGGDWTNNGTFNQREGLVVFDGSSTQQILGSTETTFYEMEITNQSNPGVQVVTDTDLEYVLTMGTSAEFDPDGTDGNSIFTLLSDGDNGTTSQDASIAPLPGTAVINGNLNIQRYMSGEGRMWRYLTCGVWGATVEDWQDNFPITGSFDGADVLGGANNPSLYYYNEATLGGIDDGWTAYPVSINTEPIYPYVGYSVYIREQTNPTIVDVRGSITDTRNRGNVNFGVTYSSSGTPANDGWNLLGNPYPSAIDWESSNWNTVTNISPSIYIRDNANNGRFASYNKASQTGVNGGTRYIASGQSFWIKATTTSPSLIGSENIKVSNKPEFFKIKGDPSNTLRMLLADADNSDESVIRLLENSTMNYDEFYDTPELPNSSLNLSSISADSIDLSINLIPLIECDETIKLKVDNTEVGDFSITFSSLETFENEFDIILFDHRIDSSFNTRADLIYEFTIADEEDANDLAAGERFELLFRASMTEYDKDIVSTEAVCETDLAEVTIINAQDGHSYQAFLGDAAVSDAMTGADKDLTLSIIGSNLQEGDNDVKVKVQKSGCEFHALDEVSIIEMVPIHEISETTDADGCSGSEVEISATGAPVDGTYNWYTSIDAEDPISDQNGSSFITPILTDTTKYYVTAVNSLGCESAERVEVVANIVPIYEITTTEGASACTENSVILTSSGAPENGSYNWYTSADASAPVADQHDATFETPVLSETTTFYVTAVNTLGCESSERVPVVAEIVPVKEVTSVQGASGCIGSSFTLMAEGANEDESYNWYLSEEAAEPISDQHEAAYITPELTESTTYYVTVVNSLNCESSERVPVSAEIIAAPDIASSEGDRVCNGSSATLTATGTPENGTYNWYESLDASEPLSDQHDGTLDLVEVTESTTYYVTAVNSTGCESAERTAVTAEVITVTVPTAISGSVCGTGSVTLSAQKAGAEETYQWYDADELPIDGAVDAEYITSTLTSDTEFYVSIVSAEGCVSEKILVQATVLEVEAPATTSASRCEAGSVTLTASGAGTGDKYQWYDSQGSEISGSTGAEYTTPELESTTQYSVSIISSDGCESELIPVEAGIIIVQVEITASESIDTLFALGNAEEFQWYRGSEIIDDGTEDYYVVDPSQTASFYVEATLHGCTGISETYNITGLKEDLSDVIDIFPNPSSGVVTIRCTDIIPELEAIQVLDLSGKMLMVIDKPDLSNDYQLDLSSYTNGLYFIKGITDQGTFIKKIIKE